MTHQSLSKKILNKTVYIYETYQYHLFVVSFIFGFIFDNLTMTRVDVWLDNLILITQLSLVAIAIAILNIEDEGKLRAHFVTKYAFTLPFFIQFLFGSLFGRFFLLYWKGTELTVNWPFLILILGFLVANEIVRKQYIRSALTLSIFFVAIFLYAIFLVPIIFGRMGADMFLVSGAASIIIISIILIVFWQTTPARFRQSRNTILASVGIMYLGFNLLYFTNAIPPLPLSLKDIGLYHSVSWNENGQYHFLFEPATTFFYFKQPSTLFHQTANEPVYVYSAVFAPTDLTTKIFHRWSYFDEKKKEWITTDRLTFTIRGGRDGGYRGFSVKEHITPGKWRVDVETERGQLVGRITFEVRYSATVPLLENRVSLTL
ncbi:MAG: DUF2914 domain-containing protein [bacterium]|nr:DUF2914 domain-containing protein [bacterium]